MNSLKNSLAEHHKKSGWMTETDGPKSDTFPVKFRNENTNCTFGVKIVSKTQ